MNVSFHRGANNWVAAFDWDGRQYVAFLDRNLGLWRWGREHLIDPATRSELQVELTNKLKQFLNKE